MQNIVLNSSSHGEVLDRCAAQLSGNAIALRCRATVLNAVVRLLQAIKRCTGGFHSRLSYRVGGDWGRTAGCVQGRCWHGYL